MKHLICTTFGGLIALLMFPLCIACNNRKDAASDSGSYSNGFTTTVYICTGSSSERYHSNPDCRGLNRCNGSIEAVTESEAESMGRTPCHICY